MTSPVERLTETRPILSEEERLLLGRAELQRRAELKVALQAHHPSIFFGPEGNKLERTLDGVIHGAMHDTIDVLCAEESPHADSAEVIPLFDGGPPVPDDVVNEITESEQGE
jgi:hypothetical protein